MQVQKKIIIIYLQIMVKDATLFFYLTTLYIIIFFYFEQFKAVSRISRNQQWLVHLCLLSSLISSSCLIIEALKYRATSSRGALSSTLPRYYVQKMKPSHDGS